MQRLFTVLSLIALLLVSACSSGPPKPEIDFNPAFDFTKARTVAFYKNSGSVSGENPLLLSDMQRSRIDDALRVAVDNKGLTFLADASKADLLLSWHLATQQKTDVRTYQSASYGGMYGHSGRYNRYSMYNCWNCGSTQVSVKNYTEGTFIVDLIDPKAKQSVWRSVTESRLKGKLDKDQSKYDAAAAAIFESFPPL